MQKVFLLILVTLFSFGAVFSQAGRETAERIARRIEAQQRADLQPSVHSQLREELAGFCRNLGAAYPDDPEKVKAAMLDKLEEVRDRPGAKGKPGGDHDPKSGVYRNPLIAEWVNGLIRDLMDHNYVSLPRADQASNLTLRPVGRGRTTTDAITLYAYNSNPEAITVVLEPCYIPPANGYQGYVSTEYIVFGAPANATTAVTIHEIYCTDITLPPIEDGALAPQVGSWVFVSETIPVAEAYSPTLPVWEPVPIQTDYVVMNPATNTPFPYMLDPVANPVVTGTILLNAIDNITATYDSLRLTGDITTPFSSDAVKERESVNQQTYWLCVSTLTGGGYKLSDFRQKTIEQYEANSGQSFAQLDTATRLAIDQGVGQFWHTFEGIGEKAKVMQVSAASTEKFPPVAEHYYQIYEQYRKMGESHEDAMKGTWASKSQRDKWSEKFRDRYERENRQ